MSLKHEDMKYEARGGGAVSGVGVAKGVHRQGPPLQKIGPLKRTLREAVRATCADIAPSTLTGVLRVGRGGRATGGGRFAVFLREPSKEFWEL